MTKLLVIAQAFAIAATLYAGFAQAGEVIAKKDLPASIQTQTAKKAPKFPGVPACSKGRTVMTWTEVNALPGTDEKGSVAADDGKAGDHKCSDADKLYVCTAFGKLSIRCE